MCVFFSSFLLQLESVWSLTNITSGDSDQTAAVVAADAIPPLVALLRSPSVDVQLQSAWTISNIACDSARCRDLVLAADAMQPLLALDSPEATIPLKQQVAFAIKALCCGQPPPEFAIVQTTIPVLARLIDTSDVEVLSSACGALAFLSDDASSQLHQLTASVEAGLVPRLLQLLTHTNPDVLSSALTIIRRIAGGREDHVATLLTSEELPSHEQPLWPLRTLISHARPAIRKDALSTIALLVAGGKSDRVELLFSLFLLAPLLMCARNDGEEMKIRHQAASAIASAADNASDDQLRRIVRTGHLQPLCRLLIDCRDPELLLCSLRCLESILRVGRSDALAAGQSPESEFAVAVRLFRACDRLEQLYCHEDESVRERAELILHTYFELEEVSDEEEDSRPTKRRMI